MTGLLRLLPPGRAALAVGLGTLTVLAGAALLAASGALITAAAQRPSTLLVLMPLITAVRLFGVARPALRYAERLVAHDLTLRLVGRVRAELLGRLLPLSPAVLTGARSGDLLARLRSDVDELQGAYLRLAGPAAVALLASTAAVGLTALVSPPSALVVAGLLLCSGVLVPLWARSAGRRSSLAAAAAEADFGSDALDLVRGLGDHLAGDGGRTARRGLDAALEAQERAEREAARSAAAATALREGVPAVGLVAALWLVGSEVLAGTAGPVLLATTALGVLGAFEAVGGLGTAWLASAGTSAAAARLEALRRERPAVQDPPRPRPAPPGPPLRLEGVRLDYAGAAVPALDGLDLEVAAGEKVALLGPSGAGKSSVLALALRVRDPDEGRVLLGGVDLRELALEDVRARSAWAPQAPLLLGGTLALNLRLGRDEACDAELEAVLRSVGLGALLEPGGPGLSGWVGEAGERLSAGERARVGLARALLSPAPLLLLDEPTAHLDAATAEQVLGLLARQERAVLVVTHRPQELGPSWRRVHLQPPARVGEPSCAP